MLSHHVSFTLGRGKTPEKVQLTFTWNRIVAAFARNDISTSKQCDWPVIID